MPESKKKLDPKAIVSAGLQHALNFQQPLAAANLQRLRRLHPDKSPAELIAFMNKFYLAAVTAGGAGAGATAIVPNVAIQLPVAGAEMLGFLEVSVQYILTVAEIHEIDVEDRERRALLVTAVLIGDSAAKGVMNPLLKRSVPYWGKKVVDSIPLATIKAANKILGPRFVTRYGTRAGVLVLGKQLPLFIGVGIGAGGNHLFGRSIVSAAKKILGPPNATWSSAGDVVPSP
jgi:hypothetical protein